MREFEGLMKRDFFLLWNVSKKRIFMFTLVIAVINTAYYMTGDSGYILEAIEGFDADSFMQSPRLPYYEIWIFMAPCIVAVDFVRRDLYSHSSNILVKLKRRENYWLSKCIVGVCLCLVMVGLAFFTSAVLNLGVFQWTRSEKLLILGAMEKSIWLSFLGCIVAFLLFSGLTLLIKEATSIVIVLITISAGLATDSKFLFVNNFLLARNGEIRSCAIYFVLVGTLVIVSGYSSLKKSIYMGRMKMMSREYITLKNVTKMIKNNRVLDNITISFEENKIYGIEGINGSGKTMLLRAVAGLIRTEGEIKVDGIIVGEREYPRDIGVLIENPGFLEEFTGKENLKLISFMTNNVSDNQIEHVLEEVGLDVRDKRKYSKYSLGMKQRLGIAQALLGEPKLILLDEPTNALDTEGINRTKKLICLYKEKGATILIASHDKEFLDEMADERFVMERGRIK